MSAHALSDVTLLTEHLTYRPAALIDDVVNSINILAFKATEAVEKGLLAANPTDLGFKLPPQNTPEGIEAARVISERVTTEIENGVHQLETLLESKIDKNFDRLEIYALRNILNVPEDLRNLVRLSHYEGINAAPEKDAPNTESICLQRKKLRETQKLHAYLRAESARNKATIMTLRSLIINQSSKQESDSCTNKIYPAFGFLQNETFTGDASQPVTTSTSFALSQLPALQSLLKDLEPRLGRLTDTIHSEGSEKDTAKSFRRERFEFIEKETRRHLENVRQLDLGEMGEVRDEEWHGSGRKIDKAEVEDLEKVIQLFCADRENKNENSAGAGAGVDAGATGA
ncbi:hypothetical protein K3495_g5837 [Podosphaera aphanis]|nr:hypothetical protein K3495_g5837 [Podosphaera aphanis]